MKLTFQVFSTLSFLAYNSHANSGLKLHHFPQKISYETLRDEDYFQKSGAKDSFLDALTKHGIVSITNVPGYKYYKKKALKQLHPCALDSKTAKQHIFSDGTIRLTFATSTIPEGQQEIPFNEHDLEACKEFLKASELLRNSVAEGVRAFSNGLNYVLDTATPVLSTKDENYDFKELKDVIENGIHLEHFHSYERSVSGNSVKEGIEENTINLHTDQGLFIAFAPALSISTTSDQTEIGLTSSEDFYIELKDGSISFLEFDDDDLIFMLGDGVNQIINPKLRNEDVTLRPTPHGLNMPYFDKARVWYGRMVLPPTDAVHPEYELTFGNLRQRMIEESLSAEKNHEVALGVGCSGRKVARQMEENVCAEGSIYCWSRCMELDDFNVSSEICSQRNLQVQCINEDDKVYDGGHGDFYPACSNSTEKATVVSSDEFHGQSTEEEQKPTNELDSASTIISTLTCFFLTITAAFIALL